MHPERSCWQAAGRHLNPLPLLAVLQLTFPTPTAVALAAPAGKELESTQHELHAAVRRQAELDDREQDVQAALQAALQVHGQREEQLRWAVGIQPFGPQQMHPAVEERSAALVALLPAPASSPRLVPQADASRSGAPEGAVVGGG